MVRGLPVKARALHQHDLGFLEQFQEKLLVVFDGIHLGVQAREHIQSSLRLHTRHARNSGDELIGQVALLAQTTTLAHQIVDALVAAQSSLDCPLTWHVGTQAHVREHVEALDVISCRLFVA